MRSDETRGPVSHEAGEGSDDNRVLRLSPGDNVVIARSAIREGSSVLIGGIGVPLSARVDLGFKLAADDLPALTTVVRAGVPIGRTTAAVARGELVHTHNLESLYLRTHARGES